MNRFPSFPHPVICSFSFFLICFVVIVVIMVCFCFSYLLMFIHSVWTLQACLSAGTKFEDNDKKTVVSSSGVQVDVPPPLPPRPDRRGRIYPNKPIVHPRVRMRALVWSRIILGDSGEYKLYNKITVCLFTDTLCQSLYPSACSTKLFIREMTAANEQRGGDHRFLPICFCG